MEHTCILTAGIVTMKVKCHWPANILITGVHAQLHCHVFSHTIDHKLHEHW